jgi:polyhydroxyalkanoate synthase
MNAKTVKKPKETNKNQDQGHNPHMIDPIELSQTLLKVSQEIQPLLQEFFSHYDFNPADMVHDPMNMQESYVEFLTHLFDNPQKLFDMQMQFWSDWATLCQESTTKFLGGEADNLFDLDLNDKRFKSPAWSESAYFDFIKQSYLLTGKWLQDIIHKTEGLDDETRNKMEFQTKQFVDAIAPTNFLFTNPDVLKETIETGGDNLIKGISNLLEDLKRGHGELKISTTNYEAFEVGKNLAVSKGDVIYQNDLMQLIQYKAKTKKVYKRPILIVPPWINKFYILDLKPENSLINWLVEKGHTVFTISWVNPDKELSKKSFDDYMKLGILDALKQVKKVTGEDDCNLLGYCLGGTLQAITLSYLQQKSQQNKVASATFLTTLIDFELAGDMKLFIDDAQLEVMNKEMAQKGFLPASSLKQTFSLMRANDLIWSFVINMIYYIGMMMRPTCLQRCIAFI